MRLRVLAALGLVATMGVGTAAAGCYDDTQASGAGSAASIRRPTIAPRGDVTPPPSPQDMPGGGRGYSDFTKGQKGKP